MELGELSDVYGTSVPKMVTQFGALRAQCALVLYDVSTLSWV